MRFARGGRAGEVAVPPPPPPPPLQLMWRPPPLPLLLLLLLPLLPLVLVLLLTQLKVCPCSGRATIGEELNVVHKEVIVIGDKVEVVT